MFEGKTERDGSLKLTKAEGGEETDAAVADAAVMETKTLKVADMASEVVAEDVVETLKRNAKTVRTLP